MGSQDDVEGNFRWVVTRWVPLRANVGSPGVCKGHVRLLWGETPKP